MNKDSKIKQFFQLFQRLPETGELGWKKLINDFKNNEFFQLIRNNLPEAEEPGLEQTKKGSRFNQIFRKMPEEDVDFATDVRATILAQTPQGGRMIIWATLILLVIFLIWAAFSELEEVTRGEGKVVPSSHVQVVQNLEGGIISEILVNVGR